ncbi:S41 family peptidase [soil metagenome]
MNKKILLPVSIILVAIGVFIGMKINAVSDDKFTAQIKKYGDVLNITTRNYVDEVDSQKLTEAAIKGMLQELDPHSVYIPAEQLKSVNEEFQGSFEGIGVEFDIVSDTITIVSPIAGGPSEKLGIIAGDKIVKIDGQPAVKLTREDVPKKLRGAKGTKVVVTIIRAGTANPMDFEIVRDKIPIYTVDASFMYNKDIGYIKVARFAATTMEEFKAAYLKLKSAGMSKMILDLRGNPGGYLDQAFKMSSEFLPKGRKIVFTKSRVNEFNEQYISEGGALLDIPLVVLVNGGSASASEIVSGALQDWDRGLIVGETTFGKGLVQRQYDLSDASAFRVTIARYYTPIGRSIQKPYEKGKYNADLVRNEQEGDNLYHNNDVKDSTKPEYKTFGGRIVYGGGGVTPDYIVKLDTLTPYTVSLRRINIFYLYTENFMKQHRSSIESRYKNYTDFRDNFQITEAMLNDLKNMAISKDIKTDDFSFDRDKLFYISSIKSLIARDIWGNEGSYAVFVNSDEQFLKAITLFNEASELSRLNR